MSTLWNQSEHDSDEQDANEDTLEISDQSELYDNDEQDADEETLGIFDQSESHDSDEHDSHEDTLEIPTPVLTLKSLDPEKCLSQEQSPLFSVIPPEIRNLIFHFALLSHEDTTRPYSPQTCYLRPGYTAPLISSTSLLRTCQRIYREAWHRPWTSAEHTLFLTAPDRAPERTTTLSKLRSDMRVLLDAGEHAETDHVRVFAQLYRLEPGYQLQEILEVPGLRPKCITITLRHSDWWFWESDEPLRIAATWVRRCRFPDSVKRICMELETLERKTYQVSDIASQMREKWFFRRKDDTILAVRSDPEVMTWTGDSTICEQRWVRDEVRPGELDYRVLTLSWVPLRGEEVDEEKYNTYPPNLRAKRWKPGERPEGMEKGDSEEEDEEEWDGTGTAWLPPDYGDEDEGSSGLDGDENGEEDEDEEGEQYDLSEL